MKGILHILQERGLIDAVAGEGLEQALSVPTKVYLGFDPTADSLHLGNFLGMVVLSWFQRAGHTPVIVLGGATGGIGDPSGKSTERPLLDGATLQKNIEGIRKNFSRIFDMSGKYPLPIFVNNGDWFSSFLFVDFLRDVGKHFRMGTMLAKDSVRSRVHSEEGMSFTEFSYQLLQAYDFYHLFQEGVYVQLGGSDQWGNITAGIELIRRKTGHSAFGLTFPLLTRSDGKKFGKSESGAVWLSSDKLSPYEFYQYCMSIPDSDVTNMMRKLTYMPMEEIACLEQEMCLPTYVANTAQKQLALTLTEMIHGTEGVEVALRVTRSMMPGSKSSLVEEDIAEIAKDMPYVEKTRQEIIGLRFVEVVVSCGLLGSRGEATRLIQNQGAYINQDRVENVQRIIEEQDCIGGRFIILGAGKKKKILVQLL